MFSTVFLFLNIGSQEMIFIFVIALLFFGGKKLPELARGLGKGIREFKDASENIKRDINDQINDFEKDADRPSTKNTTASTTHSESGSTDNSAAETPKLDQSVDIPERPDDYAGEFDNTGENPDDVSHSDSFYKHNYDYNEPEEYVSSSEGTAADKDDVRS